MIRFLNAIERLDLRRPDPDYRYRMTNDIIIAYNYGIRPQVCYVYIVILLGTGADLNLTFSENYFNVKRTISNEIFYLSRQKIIEENNGGDDFWIIPIVIETPRYATLPSLFSLFLNKCENNTAVYTTYHHIDLHSSSIMYNYRKLLSLTWFILFL